MLKKAVSEIPELRERAREPAQPVDNPLLEIPQEPKYLRADAGNMSVFMSKMSTMSKALADRNP